MHLEIFSIYDKAVKAFLRPFYARTRGEAIRMFSDSCFDEKSEFNKHAEDYLMMYLGRFDDNTGLFTPCEPERVISAMECAPDTIGLDLKQPPRVVG